MHCIYTTTKILLSSTNAPSTPATPYGASVVMGFVTLVSCGITDTAGNAPYPHHNNKSLQTFCPRTTSHQLRPLLWGTCCHWYFVIFSPCLFCGGSVGFRGLLSTPVACAFVSCLFCGGRSLPTLLITHITPRNRLGKT